MTAIIVICALYIAAGIMTVIANFPDVCRDVPNMVSFQIVTTLIGNHASALIVAIIIVFVIFPLMVVAWPLPMLFRHGRQ